MSADYLQPWKLVALACGMVFLFWGALTGYADDWTITNTIVMGLATYITAPWAYRLVRAPRDWVDPAVALLLAWFTVDTLYLICNGITGDPIYREVNLLVSGALYVPCAIIFGQRGTLREVLPW